MGKPKRKPKPMKPTPYAVCTWARAQALGLAIRALCEERVRARDIVEGSR